MINSDGKSQSYSSKYVISSHNVLICLSKLLGQRRLNVGHGEWFNLSYHMINFDGKSQTSYNSYNRKYAISSHKVLIYLSKLLGQRRWNVGLDETLKVIILAALIQKLRPKTRFRECWKT